MHIDNSTPFEAAFTGAMDPEGREHVVLAIKATFEFTDAPASDCRISSAQRSLLMADEFWGAPGLSAPKAEMDFAHTKERCDVLLDAVAHAPGVEPTERAVVGVKVGDWQKTLSVVGNRVWTEHSNGLEPSDAEAFTTMPLTYDLAFGGVDRSNPEEDAPLAYEANPVGRGWHRSENASFVSGQPMPNLEVTDRPIKSPWEEYPPVSFGPVGRGWPARLCYAGTYDQNWLDNGFPFLPADFDVRYYQAAPEDQQIPFPSGGEEVALLNLTPGGRVSFRLPDGRMPVTFGRARDEDISMQAVLDTIVIDTKALVLTMTWRASVPLKRDIFEIPECIVGQRSKAFWRARALGKAYYPSLKDLARSEQN